MSTHIETKEPSTAAEAAPSSAPGSSPHALESGDPLSRPESRTCEELLGPRPMPTPFHRWWYAFQDGPLTWLLFSGLIAPLTWQQPFVWGAVVSIIYGNWIFPGIVIAATIIGYMPFRRSEWVINSALCRMIVRYFDVSVTADRPDHLLQGGPMMMVHYPHGIFSLSTIATSFVWFKVLPECPAYGLLNSSLLMLTIHRAFMIGIGAVAATKEKIKAIAAKGHIVCVTPGGLAEGFMIRPDRETVLMRKGFLRESLMHGMDLMPLWHYGNTSTLSYMVPAWTLPYCERFARRTRMMMVPYYGRWYLPVPRKVKFTIVSGRRIKVDKCENPTDEMIEELAAEFKRALEELYYAYRPEGDKRDLMVVCAWKQNEVQAAAN